MKLVGLAELTSNTLHSITFRQIDKFQRRQNVQEKCSDKIFKICAKKEEEKRREKKEKRKRKKEKGKEEKGKEERKTR